MGIAENVEEGKKKFTISIGLIVQILLVVGAIATALGVQVFNIQGLVEWIRGFEKETLAVVGAVIGIVMAALPGLKESWGQLTGKSPAS